MWKEVNSFWSSNKTLLKGEQKKQIDNDSSSILTKAQALEWRVQQFSSNSRVRKSMRSGFTLYCQQQRLRIAEFSTSIRESHAWQSRKDLEDDSNIDILDCSDGYTVQYWSGTALFMLNKLAQERKIVISRAIDAESYDKKSIDGFSGGDKAKLTKEFCGNTHHVPKAGKNLIYCTVSKLERLRGHILLNCAVKFWCLILLASVVQNRGQPTKEVKTSRGQKEIFHQGIIELPCLIEN